MAAVSFGWTVILSVMQGKFDAAIAQKGHAVGDGSSGGSGSSPAAVAEALAAADGARAKAANGGLGSGGGAALPADQNEAANVLQEHDADIIF